MPRPSKYTPERVEKILNVLAISGSREAAWKAGDISEPTFYAWFQQYPEFQELVEEAEREFRKTCPEALIREAKKALYEAVTGRQVRRMHSVKRMQKQEVTESGEVVTLEGIEETTGHITLAPPQWAIERILGKPVEELEGLTVAAVNGWIPPSIPLNMGQEIAKAKQRSYEFAQGELPQMEEVDQSAMSAELADWIKEEVLLPGNEG